MPARISFYRPTGQSRRSARAAHDHDVFEGLPVRRWALDWVSVGRPAAAITSPQPDLPLPKDAHLMSATSQGLLAAARAGSSNSATVEEVPKPRETTHPEPLFRTKRWVRFPKDQEPPEPIYLAKVPGGHHKAVIVEDSTPVVAPVVVGHVGVGRGGKTKPPSNRGRGRRGRGRGMAGKVMGRKTVSFVGEDVPMADAVDAATKVEAVPENGVAKEMDGLEKGEEVEAMKVVHDVKEGRVEVDAMV